MRNRQQVFHRGKTHGAQGGELTERRGGELFDEIREGQQAGRDFHEHPQSGGLTAPLASLQSRPSVNVQHDSTTCEFQRPVRW